MTACPTPIDIPLFIRRIATGTTDAAVRTILGGICTRVCPTEPPCEEICARGGAGGKPVGTGRQQGFVTDHLMAQEHPSLHPRAGATGKPVAVVGHGPDRDTGADGAS